MKSIKLLHVSTPGFHSQESPRAKEYKSITLTYYCIAYTGIIKILKFYNI
jgi:hypothetical protein